MGLDIKCRCEQRIATGLAKHSFITVVAGKAKAAHKSICETAQTAPMLFFFFFLNFSPSEDERKAIWRRHQ